MLVKSMWKEHNLNSAKNWKSKTSHSPFKFGTVSIVSRIARLFMSYMYVFSCKTTINLHIELHYVKKEKPLGGQTITFQQIGTYSQLGDQFLVKIDSSEQCQKFYN